MIEGIKFEVAADEMARIFEARADYHRKRGAQQAEELPKLRAIIDGLKVPAFAHPNGVPGITYGNSGYANRDPVAELEERVASHKNEASKYDFYAKHTIPSETYRVAAPDLGLLGINDGTWGAIAFGIRR